MDTATIQLVQGKIDALPEGATFDVKTLMGVCWASTPGKQAFGRIFKTATSEGKITGIIHDHLDNSPRRDIYRRVIHAQAIDC